MAGFAAAVAFTWFGMVLAISFMEAPLKFRAPGVTLPLGLGIGRLVFRGLNALEAVAAVLLAVALALGDPGTGEWVLTAGLWLGLAVQVGGLRPVLERRAAAVIDGRPPPPRPSLHVGYIGLEVCKVVALAVLGGLWSG